MGSRGFPLCEGRSLRRLGVPGLSSSAERNPRRSSGQQFLDFSLRRLMAGATRGDISVHTFILPSLDVATLYIFTLALYIFYEFNRNKNYLYFYIYSNGAIKYRILADNTIRCMTDFERFLNNQLDDELTEDILDQVNLKVVSLIASIRNDVIRSPSRLEKQGVITSLQTSNQDTMLG